MRRTLVFLVTFALPSLAGADDVTGVEKLLCSVGIATHCTADGECTSGTPETWDIARFFEVHLDEGMLTSTEASQEDLSTPIDRVEREAGGVSLQGVEDGLAWSLTISKENGRAVLSASGDGVAYVVFGVCKPVVD